MAVVKDLRSITLAALCSAAILAPTMAVAQDMEDKAIATRQGYMKLVLWEAGPLFGMAKGEVPYDAEAAKAHAAKLKTISEYPAGGLFVAGTSKSDRPGKTRALAKIWEDMAGFGKAFTDWQAAVAALGDEAGNGQPALAAAVGEMGKTCGGCHKPYRAKEF